MIRRQFCPQEECPDQWIKRIVEIADARRAVYGRRTIDILVANLFSAVIEVLPKTPIPGHECGCSSGVMRRGGNDARPEVEQITTASVVAREMDRNFGDSSVNICHDHPQRARLAHRAFAGADPFSS
jgi:hypothetical protein